jgi:hypothetical protein
VVVEEEAEVVMLVAVHEVSQTPYSLKKSFILKILIKKY